MATRERYLTPAEVCERYGISRQTLYNWRTAGAGPRATKIGGQLRFHERDLLSFEASGRESVREAGQHG